MIGLLYVLYLLVRETWNLLSGFCAFFLAPMGISRMNLKKYGGWAGEYNSLYQVEICAIAVSL